MADKVANPFAFINRLPEATITQPFEKHTGVFVQAALVEGPGRNVFVEVISGPKVPVRTYTVNVGGRGALVIAEQEFRDLLSSGLALFEIHTTSKDAPTNPAAALPSMPAILAGTSD